MATDDSDSTGPPPLIPRLAISVSSSDSDSEDSSDDELPSLVTKRVEDSSTVRTSIPDLVLGKRTMPTKVPEWIMANRREEEETGEEKRAVITIMVDADFDFACELESELKRSESKLELKLESESMSDMNGTNPTMLVQDSKSTDD